MAEPVEVILRVAARSPDRAAIERLAIEVAPMHFGPAGLAGYIGGGPRAGLAGARATGPPWWTGPRHRPAVALL